MAPAGDARTAQRQDAALLVTPVRKRRASAVAAGVTTQAQESERSIAARRSIEHAHAVSELRDAVARVARDV